MRSGTNNLLLIVNKLPIDRIAAGIRRSSWQFRFGREITVHLVLTTLAISGGRRETDGLKNKLNKNSRQIISAKSTLKFKEV